MKGKILSTAVAVFRDERVKPEFHPKESEAGTFCSVQVFNLHHLLYLFVFGTGVHRLSWQRKPPVTLHYFHKENEV